MHCHFSLFLSSLNNPHQLNTYAFEHMIASVWIFNLIYASCFFHRFRSTFSIVLLYENPLCKSHLISHELMCWNNGQFILLWTDVYAAKTMHFTHFGQPINIYEYEYHFAKGKNSRAQNSHLGWSICVLVVWYDHSQATECAYLWRWLSNLIYLRMIYFFKIINFSYRVCVYEWKKIWYIATSVVYFWNSFRRIFFCFR